MKLSWHSSVFGVMDTPIEASKDNQWKLAINWVWSDKCQSHGAVQVILNHVEKKVRSKGSTYVISTTSGQYLRNFYNKWAVPTSFLQQVCSTYVISTTSGQYLRHFYNKWAVLTSFLQQVGSTYVISLSCLRQGRWHHFYVYNDNESSISLSTKLKK